MKLSTLKNIFNVLVILVIASSCGADNKMIGDIEITNVVNSDNKKPTVSFSSAPSVLTGNANAVINFSAVDEAGGSGLAKTEIFYSPEPGVVAFKSMGTVPTTSTSFDFCVPNKNHTAPTFKIKATDISGNTGETTLTGYSITRDTDPALPGAFTSDTAALTKQNPATFSIDTCPVNSCTSGSLKYETPTKSVYTMYNTTATQPLVGDGGWQLCSTALASGMAETFPSDGSRTYNLWIKTDDTDYDNVTSLIEVSSASVDQTIEYDNTAPVDVDPTSANVQFTDVVVEPAEDFDNDGNLIGLSWTSFTDANLANYKISTFTDAACTLNEVDHGAIGSVLNNDAVIVNGLTEGQYWAKVTAVDALDAETTSACSLDSIYVDVTAPVDNGADLQFTDTVSITGNGVAVTWTAFTDLNLVNHRVITYTDNTCTTQAVDHGLSSDSNSATLNGLTGTGDFYATVTAYDGVGNSRTSACSTDKILIDTESPTDNGADLQFTDSTDTLPDLDADGNNIFASWVAFTDGNGIADHRLITFTDAGCTLPSALGTDHGKTGSGTNTDSAIIDGLADGVYWGKVEAEDGEGNVKLSACSTDSFRVDKLAPVDAPAVVQFTAVYTNVNNNTAMTWTAFTDDTLTDHRVKTYTDSGCTVGGEVDRGLTSSTSASHSITAALTDDEYWARVTAIDALGRETTSACSTDTVVIDTNNPTEDGGGADLQFTDAYTSTTDNIAVTWTAFTDTNLKHHILTTYRDSSCTAGAGAPGFEVAHPTAGTTTNSDSTQIDGLTTEGEYWAKITAVDEATNTTTSACSTDSIIIDTTDPTDNTATVLFTDTHDADGLNVALTWTAFSDTNSITDHRVLTYTNSLCTLGEEIHAKTASGTASTTVTLAADGQYWAKVEAFDPALNSTVSACSADSIFIDTTAPVDNTATFLFTAVETKEINNIAATWTAFTDLTLKDHRIDLFTEVTCTTGFAIGTGLTGSNGNTDNAVIDGLAEGEYWAKVTALDYFDRPTTSACSADTVIIDLTKPSENGGGTLAVFDAVLAGAEVADDYDTDGDDIAVSWNAFSDNNTLTDHEITTYTNSGCSTGAEVHPKTGSATNSNATVVDGLADNHYWFTVTAYDMAGNFRVSPCTLDELIVDTIHPAENGAGTLLTFTNTHDVDGNDIAVTWNAFTDTNAILDYQIVTFTNSACTTPSAAGTVHPLIGSNAVADAVTVDGLADGTYWGKVRAYDSAGNTTDSACSTDSIIVDSTAPVDGGPANLQFTLVNTTNTDNIAVTWTAFTDLSTVDHSIALYTDSLCSIPFDFGAAGQDWTGSGTNSDNVIIDGLADDEYWGKVTAKDFFGKETTSACSTDTYIADTTDPVDTTANIQFTDVYDVDGDNIAVTWTAFTDTYLSDHRIITYSNSGCTDDVDDHGLTGSSTNANAVIVDGLTPDGHYWAKVTAYDIAGNSVESACSTDEIIVDTINPTDNTAALQFTNTYNNTGNDVAVTWTAFTDTNNMGNHQIETYTDSACSLGLVTHPLTGSGTNSDAASIDGLTDGDYYGKVIGYDNAGNSTTSLCSTDFITIDTVAPDQTPISVIGTVVTPQAIGIYNLSDCSDVAFVQITQGAGAPPLAGAGTWQACDETGYSITYTGLNEGLNALQFWIKDAADNVQTGFIAHNTIYQPPVITVVDGPTISVDTATMTIDICEEAKIKEVLFNETGTPPLVGDVAWQPCSKAVGALSYGTLTPGVHTLKTFYKYDDDGMSTIPQDVPVTYEPVITWEDSPIINRPQLSFTLGSCSGITHVLFNQTTEPASGDAAWQACTTGTGLLTHSLTTEGSQSLNIWFKDGAAVYSDFIQKTVNFDPPTGYIFTGSLVSTNTPMLSADDCLNINKIFIKLDDVSATAPSVADFNGGSGINCTTALNALAAPTMGAVEGPHFYDVWFKFTDDYILDPWYTRINVTYLVEDTTAPPITIGQSADANTTITLTNGDGSGPPPTITLNSSRAYYTLDTCIPKAPVALTGTAAITAGTNTVTGVGTLFTTELSTGDYINIAGEVLKVVVITDNLNISLATNHVAGSAAIAATREYPDDTYTHMILTDSITAPSSSDPDWLTCSTTASDFKTKSLPDGTHNLYAWFKDASDNVSTSITDQVVILTTPDTIDPPRPPVIVEGAPTLTSAPAQLTVTTCFDVDQVYLETSVYPAPYVEPDPNSTGWIDCTDTVGAIEFPLTLAGSYTISVWFKDTAGNINDIPRDVSFIFDPTLGVFAAPIAYWSMDTEHKRNTKILDIKGDNHLSIWDQGNFTAPAGKNGEAIQGSGTNSILITKSDSDLQPSVGVSASMFIYLTNNDSSTKGIMGNVEVGTGGYGFSLASSNLNFYASGRVVSVATNTYTTGWHHIAGTSDGRYVNIYIDGVLKNTTDIGAPANLTYGCSSLFAVGGPVDCTTTPVTTNLFDEKIDEVAIWDTYLIESEIMTHYIDAINGFKVNQDTVAPIDVASITFEEDFLQNAHLTLPDCSVHKFIYLNETTHPPLLDSDDWQLCTTVKSGIIHPNLIQGPHELKVWTKDEYNNLSSGYLKVDTTIEALAYQKPGILYYNFDDTHLNITEVQDIFSKHHATNVGADVSQAGIKGESFLFTRAESDYVELAYASNALLKDKLTLSLWADLTNGENINQVLAGTRMASHGYSLEIDAANTELRFYVETVAGQREVGVLTSSYTTGFHHILGSFDGQVLSLYIDGEIVDTFDFGSVSPITYTCLGSFTIGAGATCSTGPVAGTHFNNNIDEVILWDTAMDAQDVEFLFNGQDSIPPSAVAVTPRGNQFTVGIPLAKFNVTAPGCSDVGSVYATLGTATPTEEIPGWQPCATTGDTIISPQLEAGVNVVKFWFKDPAGNVSLTTTDVSITYTHDSTIPTPNSYWTLDDTNIDGSLVFDVASGKDGNSFNNPTLLDSKVNEGLTFDGTTDYVEVPYDASFQPGIDVTLSAWFKVSAFDASEHVIAGNFNAAGGYALYLGNNTVEFKVQTSTGTETASFSTGGLAVDTWHHVGGVWENSTGKIRLFVNGADEVTTITGSGPNLAYTSTNSFLIGAASTSTTGALGSYFDGDLDEVAFWNSALTDTVMTALHARGNDNDPLWFDVVPPTIPVSLNILYYNSLVSRANLTITDCTGMDYVIVTKEVFPPDRNDENWQLCNTLTGGILSKELNAGDNYGKLWTKDLFGNISKSFEFVPLISLYDKPVSRPVVHWTLDDPHWVGATQTAFDRISQIDLKSETLKNTVAAAADCKYDQILDPDSSRMVTGISGVQFEGFNLKTSDDKFPTILRANHPENSKLKPTENLSVGVWVYLVGSAITNDKHIVSNEANGKGWSIRVDSANADAKGLRFTVHTAAGTLEPYLETKNYPTGWHYVLGTYDGQVASLYFDGIYVKSFTNGAPSPIVYEPGVNTFVGSKASTNDLPTLWETYYDTGSCAAFNDTNGTIANSYYQERIDEIIIWDKVLSKLEVSSLYHNGADILYDTDVTPPANPSLALENTEPGMFTNKAYFTVNDCNDISGVLVNEGTQPDKQDARWEICRERLGSFGIEDLASGGHTITSWFKDLAGNVTPVSSDLVVEYIQEALPSANASWPLDSSHNVSKYSRDVISDKIHDLMVVNTDTPLNPGAGQAAAKVNEGINLANTAGTNGAYLSAASTKLLRPVNYFSVGGWFYLTNSDGGTKILVDHHDVDDTDATIRGGYKIYLNGGNLTLKTELDIINTQTLSVSTNSYTTGWHHVIGIFTGWEQHLYIDGVVQGTNGPFAERDFIRYDSPVITNLHFGAESNQNANPGNFFGEKVDELGVWGFDLTPAEVLSIKTAGDTNTHFYSDLVAPNDMDNAFIYHYDNFGERARMTILDCTNTPFIYIQEQGNAAPSGILPDWRHCRTEPGAILSEELDLGTTYIDVYTKNSDGVVSTIAGTKEILPILWEHDLVLPVSYFSYNAEHFSGTSNHDFVINATSNDTGTPVRTPNNDGDALTLNGTTQRSSVGSQRIYDLRHGLTLAFWADITNGDAGTKPLISRTYDIDDTQVKLDGGNLVFTVNTTANNYDRTTTQPSAKYPTSKIATGKHFIVASYDGYDLKLYLDGILVDVENGNYRNYETTTFRKIEMSGLSGFNIGYDGTDYYDGEIDEFMVFDRVLTETELNAWYLRYKHSLSPGDSTAPATVPGLTVAESIFGADWPTINSSPNYKIDDCSDISGVFINLSPATVPAWDDAGWQICDTDDGHLTGPTLSAGSNTVQFWYKDSFGNVTSSSQDIDVVYTVPATPNPVAYWSFDDEQFFAHKVYEPINQLHANIFGGDVAAGKVNDAVQLDGARKYLEVEHSPIIKPTEQISVSTWINIPGTYTDRINNYAFSNRGDSAEGIMMRWRCAATCNTTTLAGTVEFLEFYITLDGNDYRLDLPQAQVGSGWKHFIYTFDSRYIKMYINGVLRRTVDTGSEKSITYNAVSETSLILGGDATDNEKPVLSTLFPGALDEFAIYDVSLNQAQVTDLYTNFANSNVKIYDPALSIVTPISANISIFDPPPGNKPFGSRLRLTLTSCTDTNMILVSDSVVAPADNDPEWQPCNTLQGGILSAPMPAGAGLSPKVWARTFTGTVSASFGTPTNAPITMPSFLSDISRPQVHWALNSTASGYTSGNNIYDSLGESHGLLDATNPPVSTTTSGDPAAIEKGYSFNGVDEFISIHPTSATNPMYDVSISAWAELKRGENVHRHIVGNLQNIATASGGGIGLRIYQGQLQFYVNTWTGTTSVLRTVGYDTNIYTDGLHHVAGTYDGRDLKLFLDGVLVNTYSIQFYQASRYEIYHDDRSTWTIGAESDGIQTAAAGSFFSGVIDDIRLWHTDLSEQEVYYAFEYGSDYIPTNVSDGIPPTDPGIFVTGNKTITETPYAYFTMPTCAGANGVEVNAIYVNLSTDPDPLEDDIGWQYCSIDSGIIISKLLALGASDVQVWFRDEEGDISPTPTTYTITYTPPVMFNPHAYYTFDAADRNSDNYYLDRANNYHIRNTSHPVYSPITGGKVGDSVRRGQASDSHHLYATDRSYVSDFNFEKNYSYSLWFYPLDSISANGTLLSTSQFALQRTTADAVRAYTGGGWKQSTGRINPNSWNHVGVTRKNGVVKIFLNGFIDSVHGIWNNNLPLNVVNFQFANTSNSSDGIYDELAIFNKELTDDQMLHLFWKGQNGLNIDTFRKERVPASVPNHYWDFDTAQFSDPTLTDITGGVDLTRINAVTTADADAKVGESFDFTRYEHGIDAGGGETNPLGNKEFLETSDAAQVALSGDFTYSVWVKNPNPTGHVDGGHTDLSAILDQWGPQEVDQSFQLSYAKGSGTSYSASIRVGGGGGGSKTVSTGWDSFSSNTNWNHLVVKRTGIIMEFFVNGVLSGYGNVGGGTIYTPSLKARFRVGESSLYNWYRQPGTVSVTAGTSIVTGVGTAFETELTDTRTGTITIGAGTAAVVGVGSLFSTELIVGQRILVNGEWAEVAAITDNLNMTLVGNHAAGATASTYVRQTPNNLRFGDYDGETHQILTIDSDTQVTLATNHVLGVTGVVYELNSSATNGAGSDEYGFDGKIDELAIWYKALGHEQIWDLYQKGNAGSAISTEPLITPNLSGTTTDEATIGLTLSDCKTYTHVWVGLDTDTPPLDGTAGWVACDTAVGALQSSILVSDAINTIRVWFKTATVVSGWTTDTIVTHASGDKTAPTPPGITQETASPTESSFARYTLATCSDIGGVYVNHSTDPAPLKDDSGWVTCNTINSAFLSPTLNVGANTISFYFKDAAGNVTSNTDRSITHDQVAIPNADLHFNFDTAQTTNMVMRDSMALESAIGKNTGNITFDEVGLIGEEVSFITNGYFESWKGTTYPTNALTFSAWVNIEAPTTDSMIYGHWDGSTANDGFAIRIDNSGRLCMDLQTVNTAGAWNTSSYKRICSVDTIEFASYQHIGIRKSSGTVNFYINNVPVGTESVDAGDFFATTLPYRIGAQDQGTSVSPVSGAIDELALWNSTLTLIELEAVYAQGLRGNTLHQEMQAQAPPIPSHYFNMDAANYSAPTLSDAVGSIDVDNILNTTSAIIGGTEQVNESASFANENKFSSAATSVNLGTQFAISAWINITAEDDQSTIINRWDVAGVDADKEFRLYTSSRRLKFDYHTTATDVVTEVGYDTITSVNQITLATWTHVMVTRNDDDLRIYINGVLEAVKSMGTDPLLDVATLPLVIGGEDAGAANWFEGSIDEVAIYKKPIAERQVQYIYAQGLANTAIPTDTVVTVAHSSSTVDFTPANITIGDCGGYAKMIAQDSGLGAPGAGTLATNCSEVIGAHQTSALPASADTVDVYLGDGTVTVHGTKYPVGVTKTP